MGQWCGVLVMVPFDFLRARGLAAETISNTADAKDLSRRVEKASSALDSVLPHAMPETKRVIPYVIRASNRGHDHLQVSNPAPATISKSPSIALNSGEVLR